MSETQIQGFSVPTEGTYVLLDDVVSAIRAYAQSLEDPNAGGLIHDLATWLDGGSDPEVEEPVTEASVPYGAEDLDTSRDIERVEVYPDPPEDPRPKWYARSIDTGGYILQTTKGSYDQEWVISNAQERWPEKQIYLLKSAGEDSKWVEDSTRGVFPSKGPPVRRLFAGAGR